MDEGTEGTEVTVPDEVVTPDAETTEVVETPEGEAEGSTEAVEAAEGDESLKSLQERLSPEDYAYVVSVREEAGKYRTERNQFRDAFEGFDDEQVTNWLTAIKAISDDPKTAHEAFSGLVTSLAEVLGTTEEEAQEIVDEAVQADAEGGDDEVLTRADLERILAEKEASDVKAREDAEALEALNRDIESLGYKTSSEDVDEQLDYLNLLHLAAEKTEGDLAAASEIVRGRDQRVIDRYLAEQEKLVTGNPPQVDGAAPVQGREKVKSIKEAAKLAKSRLDAVYGDQESE
jgi:hypothetical protein